MKGGHFWNFYLDWKPEEDTAVCAEMYMLLMASFSPIYNHPDGERGLVGLLLLRAPTGNGEENTLFKGGVFRTDTQRPQIPGSGTEFFRGCEDISVVVV